MAAITLRPYQQRVIERFENLKEPRRLFLAWDMGAGKTIASLTLAQRSRAQRILVICPALVRSLWAREAARMLPGLSVAVVQWGKARKLTKAQQKEREEAFTADVQIVSYDLLPEVDCDGWQFIIVDEFHALRSVSSKQSRNVRVVFERNPKASALGLSGTPIPNEAKQLWNPVDTFFPARWGIQSRKGYEPFSFCNAYCIREVNEFGTRFYGLREDKREELRARFASISDRVVQEDFAKYLPPLFVQPLDIGTHTKPVSVAKDWIKSIVSSVSHIGIYCHLRKNVEAIAEMLRKESPDVQIFTIDGSMASEERDDILETCRTSERSIIVGTYHALQEGISLSFQKAALVVDWISDVAAILQFLGRFSRQDSTSIAPTHVHIAIGPNDVAAAQTISERVKNINHVIRASKATAVAEQAFTVAEINDEAFEQQVEAMAQQHLKRTALWSASEDDDND